MDLDRSADEFFLGRIPVKTAPRDSRRAWAWIRATRSSASPEEVTTEDHVVEAFMDAAGSLWTRQSPPVTPRNRLTAFFSILNRDGQHIRRPSQLEVKVEH
jgi:hypothetical protein